MTGRNQESLVIYEQFITIQNRARYIRISFGF